MLAKIKISIVSAAGCLLPYLSLHTRATGLSLDESRLISIIAPLVSVLGPALAGPLVDYVSSCKKTPKTENRQHDNNACVRTALSTSVLLSAIFYCLLLSVPTVQRLKPRQPSVLFACNEDGAALVQEKCNELGCYHFPQEKIGLIRLKNCSFNCKYPSHFGYIDNPLVNDAKITTAASTSTLASTTGRTSTSSMTTTTTTTTTTVRSIGPEVDVNNLDGFFGQSINDEDDDDADLGSGEELDFDWV